MRVAILVAVFAATFATAVPVGLQTVPDSHIVLLKANANAEEFNTWVSGQVANQRGRVVYDKWSSSPKFSGVSGKFDAKFVEEAKARPDVAGVYPNLIHHISAKQANAPSYGLPRLSSRTPGAKDYFYPDSAGEGVTAYIIDTGIRTTHTEFGGRAKFLWSADGQLHDDNGHGTHVAGTVGGATYGVAKKVDLVAIRVCDGQGSCTSADIIKGVNEAIKDSKGKKAVANMSLGGGLDPTIDAAVQAGIDNGIAFAVAAGNSADDACTYSPAHVPAAVTVGALDASDRQASYSNYGECLDVYAPGTNIKSSWNTGDSASNTISGTSMASPHATGVLALFSAAGTFSPAQLADQIVKQASSGYVKGLTGESPNLVLFNGYQDTAAVVAPAPVQN